MKKIGWMIVLILIVFGLYYLIQGKKTSISETTDKNSKISQISDAEKEEVSSNLSLEIVSPRDKVIVSSAVIKIEGKTASNAEVFVNEKELKADILGNFSSDYELFEGENNIFVSANDTQGNYAEKSITVYLETTQ
ncbi:hypothetical protein HZA76_02825 [Candidatus Roizmanbacteria bacterium]|nr:hypothetical protein [Candidatus Roizmanbacteria bacterium]